MNKILIVEDNKELAEILIDALEDENYQATWVENGLKAVEYLKENQTDLVISDIQMPEMDGVQLLSWIRKQDLHLPFIVISGFSKNLESHPEFINQIDEYLEKPFYKNQILDAVHLCLGKKNVHADTSGLFVKVPIQDIEVMDHARFDIFVKLEDGHTVKVFRKSEKIDAGRIKNYKEKKMPNFYVKRIDFQKLIEFQNYFLAAVSCDQKVELKEKVELLSLTGEMIQEKIWDGNFKQEDFENAKLYAQTALSIFIEREDSFKLLKDFSTYYVDQYSHSIAVAMICNMIAGRFDMMTYKEKFNITLAAILHDIGKTKLTDEILNTPLAQMGFRQREEYYKHVDFGVQILLNLNEVPNEIIRLVQFHHRFRNGEGFPVELDAKNVDYRIQILQAANLFCETYYRLKIHNPSLRNPEKILRDFDKKIEKKILDAFAECFI